MKTLTPLRLLLALDSAIAKCGDSEQSKSNKQTGFSHGLSLMFLVVLEPGKGKCPSVSLKLG
jgi:hypothetical protein